jgi:hypothetical protein
MRILISLLVLVSLYACTPVYAQESGVIVSGVSTSLRSNKGPLTLETAESKPINFVFGSGTASPVTLSLSETGALTGLTSSTFNTLTGTSATSLISTDTADGADNKLLRFSGGGAIGGSRGSYLSLGGNESGGTGQAILAAGSVAGATVDIYTLGNNAINLYTNSLKRWDIGTSGNLTQDATNGGDLVFNRTAGLIKQGTSDSTDNRYNSIAGGGTEGISRGSFIQTFGNEFASGSLGGAIRLTGGDVTTGDIISALGNASASIKFRNASAADMFTVSNGGAVQATSTIRSSATADLGWSVVNVANQACNTTCTSACVFGMNTGALGNFVGCADATADTCICAGAS